LDTSHFYIYDSSAGSGKTYTITKEYLSILLKQEKAFAFQNILAITFTNKAAAEMKQRIVNALISFAGLDDSQDFDSLLIDVSEQTQLSKLEIKSKSLQILKFLIPNYASFEVSTIDRFNHRIIRTFARDLSLNQNFEIDMDSAPYIQKAVDQLIDEVGADEQLTSWLVEFVKYKVNNNKSGKIEKDLIDYAQLILNENNYEALEQLQRFELKDLKRIKNKISNYQKSVLEDLKSVAEQFLSLIKENNIDAVFFPRQTIPNYFKNILDEKIVGDFKSKWHENIEDTSFYSKKYEKEYGDIFKLIRPKIEELFLKSKVISLDYHLADRVLKNFVPLAMINEVQKRLNTIKKEDGILFINDFNRIISKQIKDQPAPFIYERLGEKFRHYFIDEFQDTSRLQWQNLLPLVENAITTQHDDGTSGSLYLVGDVKQSIYEWRGGDPQQFLDLSQNHKQPFSINSERKVLGDNWRSAKAIVNFNNTFFKFSAEKLTNPNHKELFKNAPQHSKKEKEGYVEINFLPEIKDKKERHEHQTLQLQKIIEENKKLGYHLNDICILVRKNQQGSAIAEAFNTFENPIPVVSQESLLIASDEKVKLLNKFFKLLHQFEHEVCVDFALDWLCFKEESQKNLTGILDKIKKMESHQIKDILSAINLEIDLLVYSKLSLYDKAEYALRLLGFEQEANAYLQFYLDEIFDFSSSKSSSMSAFIDYWDDVKGKKSITTSERTEAVNIMTIHKSKGLEFPVVIYAQANFILADLMKTNDWIELDENRYEIPFFYSSISESMSKLSPATLKSFEKNIGKEELSNMNTAYVAMTRAVDQLYILCEPILNSKKYKLENLLIDYLQSNHLFKEDQTQYSFGKKIQLEKNRKEYNQDYSEFESHDVQRYYQTLTANEILAKNSSQQIYGQEVHDLLQNVVYKNDVSKISTNEDTKRQLQDIVNHEDLSSYFDENWEIYNECDLAYGGQILRPDRVCIKDNKAVIIDYKTGIERDAHQQQLTNYKDALEAMDFSVERAILVYIRKNIYIKTI
jgi:ATP-dependent exoDNAse (exonuclease V) beta subunit